MSDDGQIESNSEPTPTPEVATSPPEPVVEAVPETTPVEDANVPTEAVTPETAEPVVEIETPTSAPAAAQSASTPVVSDNPILGSQGRTKSVATRAHKRDEHLEKIVAFARTKEFVTNDEIEKLLHVSDATASRYLKMLVARGKLVKEGKGRGVKYKIV